MTARGWGVREILRLGGTGVRLRLGLYVLLFLAEFAGIARAGDPAGREMIAVFGDSQAQGVAGGLQRVLIEDSRFKVINRTHPGAALVHGESEWLAPLRQFVSRETADVAIVMFGANDRLDLRGEDGSYLRFKTDAWRETYVRRVDKILETLTGAGLRVV